MKGPPRLRIKAMDHGAAALAADGDDAHDHDRTRLSFPPRRCRPRPARGRPPPGAGWRRPGAAQPARAAEAGPARRRHSDQGSGDSESAGERACQRYAEDQGLDVRRVVKTRRSGNNNLEATLSVEDRDDRYEARCVYDSGDREVRELEPVRGTTQARSRRGDDDEVDERLARRAQDACEDLARDRDLENVDVRGVRARAATPSRSRCAPGCAATAGISPASTTTTSARP